MHFTVMLGRHFQESSKNLRWRENLQCPLLIVVAQVQDGWTCFQVLVRQSLFGTFLS